MKWSVLTFDTGLRRFVFRQCCQDFGGVAGQQRDDGQAEAGEDAAVEQAVCIGQRYHTSVARLAGRIVEAFDGFVREQFLAEFQIYCTRSLTALSKAVLQNCQTTCNQTNATASERFQIAHTISA